MPKKLKKEKLLGVFYTLIIIFAIFIAYFFILFSPELKKTLFPAVAVLGFIFSILGFILVWLTKKSNIKGKLRFFFMLTGASAIGPFIAVLLHNFFYALGVYFEHITIVKNIMEALHVIFFLIAIPICPIIFLISAIASIILFYKKN